MNKVQLGGGLLFGPHDCMRVRGTGRVCDTCGAIPGALHIPLRARGQFCPEHCLCCNPPACATEAVGAAQEQGAATPLPDGGGAVLAAPGPRGGAFNQRPFGKRHEKYLEG